MTKRIVLFAYDALCALVCALVLAAGLVRPAYAYVDPSVMTYAIQAIAGVAVALSTVLGVAMRRTRKKLAKAMGYDENARKAHEPRLHMLDAEGNPILTAADTASAPSKKRGAKHATQAKPEIYAPKWVTRLVIGLLISAFFVFTLFIVAPYELVAGNESSLTYGLSDVWQIFVVPSIIIFAVLTIILSVVRGRAFNALALLVFGFGLATYVQVMLLNGNLPSADGATVDWTQYKSVTAWTTIVWIIIFLAPFELSRINKKLVQGVAAFLAAALIIVQGVGVASLFISSSNEDIVVNEGEYTYINSQYRVTTEGLYTVSEKKNIIVFVLDMYDTTDLQAALAQEPDLLQEMTGFTWYQNTTAVITPTRDAIPSILTGYTPTSDENLSDTLYYAYQRGPFVNDLVSAGYSVGAYSDSLPTTLPYFMECLMNSVSPNAKVTTSINEMGTLKQLWMCGLFRDLPWVCKPFLWFYTDDVNNAMVSFGQSEQEDSGTPYVIDDPSYYSALKTSKLQVTDTAETGAFRFIHLKGAHYPYTMDANGNDLGDNTTTRVNVSIGAMNIVSEYIRQLKELGLYDDATIIITADHGYFESSEPFALLTEAATPVMLIKPAQDSAAASAPYTVSSVPVSNGDVMTTVCADAGVTTTKQDGVNMLTSTDMSRKRFYTALSKTDGGVEMGKVQYEITGDALDINNWKATGWIYDNESAKWINRG